MGQRAFVRSRALESPFGEKSIFYNYYDDPFGATYPEDTTPPEGKYTYSMIICESGLEVFEKLEYNIKRSKKCKLFLMNMECLII